MLNSCHVVPTQVLSHALFFSLPSHKPQHQRLAISIPSPIPLHLPFPFLVSSANEREPQMLVSSLFSLKIFLYSVTHHPPKCQQRWVEPGGTVKGNISENHHPTPCGRGHLAHMRLTAWGRTWIAGIADSPKETGLPVLCWRSKQATFLGLQTWGCLGVSTSLISVKGWRSRVDGQTWKAMNAYPKNVRVKDPEISP